MALPVTALAAFGAYVLMFYVKADAARDRYALSLDRAYQGDGSPSTWDERRQRVVEQTLMPEGHLKAITTAVGALVLLIKPEYMNAIAYFWRNVLRLG